MSPKTQPNEPFHIANLRNQFADFTYLHCSIDQRLLTLETWCGYEYGHDLIAYAPPAFQGASKMHRTARIARCFSKSRNPISRQTHSRVTSLLKREEISSRDFGRCRRVSLRCRPCARTCGSGILTWFPFGNGGARPPCKTHTACLRAD